MAYPTNPNLLKARAFTMKLLVLETLSIQTVANRCGVHRSTVWRWKRKWNTLLELRHRIDGHQSFVSCSSFLTCA
jgi:transposase